MWEENIHIMLFDFSDTDEMIISTEVKRRAGRLKNAEEIYASFAIYLYGELKKEKRISNLPLIQSIRIRVPLWTWQVVLLLRHYPTTLLCRWVYSFLGISAIRNESFHGFNTASADFKTFPGFPGMSFLFF